LSATEEIRLERTNQLERVKRGVEKQAAQLESLKQQSETLLTSSGSSGDVTRLANRLHRRVEELTMYDATGYVDSSLPSLDARFTSSPLLGVENLIGTISKKGL